MKANSPAAAQRLANLPRPALPERGYARLFLDSVLQADRGCDFDFLVPGGRK